MNDKVEKARVELGMYNQDRKLQDYTCPSCGMEFDVTHPRDSKAYNKHPEECELLQDDVEK